MKKMQWVIVLVFVTGMSLNISRTELLAWGALTHMGIDIEAGTANGKLPVDDKLMGAYLAGATECDINAVVSIDQGVSAEYSMYHDPKFVEAMRSVAATKKSPEKEVLLARAMGYESHIKGDSVAHTGDGYPNTKQVYKTLPLDTDYLPNHVTTETLVDVLTYKKEKKTIDKYSLNFIDADTLAEVRTEYAKNLIPASNSDADKKKNEELRDGIINYDKERLKRDISSHVTKVNLAKKMANNLLGKPELMNEIDAFYSDRFTGVNGKGGLDKAVKSVATIAAGQDILTVSKDAKIKGNNPGDGNQLMQTDLALMFQGNGWIQNKVRGKILDQADGSGDKVFGEFMFDLNFKKDITMKAAMHDAETTFSQNVDNSGEEGWLTNLQAEADLLKEKVDKARNKYESKSWFSKLFDFLSGDKKKYERLQAEYDKKSVEIEELKKNIGEKKKAATANMLNTMLPTVPSAFTQPPEPKADNGKQKRTADELNILYKNYMNALQKNDDDEIKRTQKEYTDALTNAGNGSN